MRTVKLAGKLHFFDKHMPPPAPVRQVTLPAPQEPAPRPGEPVIPSQVLPPPSTQPGTTKPADTGRRAEGMPIVIVAEDAHDAAVPAAAGTAHELLRRAAACLQGVPPATTGRDLLVAYEGKFIGTYHSPRKVSNLKAYRTVAAMLREERPDFDPEALELYRPVRIERPRGTAIDGETIDRFERFAP